MTTFSQNFNSLVKVTLIDEQQQIKIETENKTNDETIVDMDEQAKSQDFFQDNNAIGKKYTTTCIKSINFLSNIAYIGISRGLLQQKLYIRHLFTID